MECIALVEAKQEVCVCLSGCVTEVAAPAAAAAMTVVLLGQQAVSYQDPPHLAHSLTLKICLHPTPP